MNMITIQAIPAFRDNYIWLIKAENSRNVLIVDPGDAYPVCDVIEKQGLNPVAILITHQHYDHINGVNELVKQYSLPVFGQKVSNNDVITDDISGQKQFVLNADLPSITVLNTPGHTATHLSYLIEDNLFCGDTLFAAGCGRLLDENGRPLPDELRASAARQLYDSLVALSALPDSTHIYCAHEYTLNNLRFAATVEPTNSMIQQRIRETDLLRQQKKPSLPSTIAMELKTNPFMRCNQLDVIQSAEYFSKTKLRSPLSVFTTLRAWKDQF